MSGRQYNTIVNGRPDAPLTLEVPAEMALSPGDTVGQYGRIVAIEGDTITFARRRDPVTMEKRGVIDENTPGCCEGDQGCKDCCGGEPTTKEGADKIQQSPVNDMIDAVADRTEENQQKS